MNKKQWITLIVVAIIFAGGGFLIGKNSASASSAPSAASGFTRGAGAAGFAGRFGAGAAGGATTGTVLSVGSGTMTIQLPTSTSTTATTGTKIVLLDNSTQITELESVAPSSLQVGQGVTLSGTANADGSITASSIQIRPAGAARGGQTPAQQ